MPRPGGEAAKLGNHYEAHWTVNAVLDVFVGEFTAITVEPLGDQSQGVEFYVESSDGLRQFHSVKRQKQGGDWSIADLCHADSASGRSILGDLFAKRASDSNLKTCFVSSTGANELRELSERARKESGLSQFRLALSPELKSKFERKLVPICINDDSRAFSRLRSLDVILISHRQLVRTVDQRIDTLFYQLDRSRLDPGEVRRTISDYVIERLGTTMDREQIRDYLLSRGFGFRDWKTDPTIRLTVNKTNDRYLSITETELINSARIARAIVDDIIHSLNDSQSKGALVVAPGGFGKSCVLAQCISRLSASRTPSICLRMDSFTPCTTSRQLGAQLDLPASPAVVLAGVADNEPSVLVVDQLDCMSLVSGRHPGLWTAFSELCVEVQTYPHMKMLLACRDFDLEHDHRLRPLAQSNSEFTKHKIDKLSRNEILDSLAAAGRVNFTPTDKQFEILGVPFHLLLFVQGKPSSRFASVAQLYDAYCDRKRQNLRERLGRTAHWNTVIDALTERMSVDQVLFAPKIIVSHWHDDAQAMVSEHVLVDMEDEQQYRFFHESFFDYAYASRFAATDGTLLDFLRTTEQHLFRRSQVRQILEYRRDHDLVRYIGDLRDIFESPDVRFHIKRMVASGLHRIEVPHQEEWQLIEPRLLDSPLTRPLSAAVYNHPGWFDLLNSQGVFRRWLNSDDDDLLDAAIRYIEPPDLQGVRSSDIAKLLRPYAHADAAWRRRILKVMSWRKIHKSSEMRSLHLELLASGTYDDHSERSTDGDLWSHHYGTEDECPTFVIDVLRNWFDRAMERPDDNLNWSFLDCRSQNRSEMGARIIQAAASSEPQYYVETMLPVVTAAILKTERMVGDHVENRLWPHLSNIGDPHTIDEAILLSLRKALQHLSKHHVDLFRRHATPILPYPHQTLGYLLLRSWQENPQEFAGDCFQYLIADLRRLNIGYGLWVPDGSGTGHCAASRRAIEASSSLCSDQLFRELESAIIQYRTEYETSHPNRRGYTELLLLQALDDSRISETTSRRIQQLRRKFPGPIDMVVEEDATFEAELIGSPIPMVRAQLMTDRQWISAMRKYSGSSVDRFGGGAHELSQVLRDLARGDRRRFASLSIQMPDDIDAVYFSAILGGMSGRFLNDDSQKRVDRISMQAVDTDVFLDVIDHAHSLPGKPCGSAIVHCISALSDRDLPSRTLATVSYYATHDPDPEGDIWRKEAVSGTRYYRGNPYEHGINCVRGQAAEAIAALLVEDQTRLDALRLAIDALSQDRTISVRTCAINSLLPMINFSRDLAVRLFVAACDGRPVMWGTRPFEIFVHYVIHTHYEQVGPLLQSALCSDLDKSVAHAARQIALAELHDVDIGSDGEQVRSGSLTMRKAAARVYARNIGKEVVGRVCMSRLEGFFNDEDDGVRSEAAKAFSYVSDEWLLRSGDFISRFIDSSAFESGPYDLLHAIEESNLAVPDVICRATEGVLKFLGEERTHVAHHESMIAKIIATLVVRQYQQTEEGSVKTRCLELIDRMEKKGYFGIGEELAKIER